MKEITVVDARMGRGKSSAAIRYMNENKGSKKFVYITPFLSEVDRICELCDFEQPEESNNTKLNEFKKHIIAGNNVATTHSLFYLLDDKILNIIKENNYDLIIDESVSLIKIADISLDDIGIIVGYLTEEDEYGKLIWKNKNYKGLYSEMKSMANAGFLYHSNGKILKMVRPKILTSFNDVIMMTYMFEGQYQKAYLDFFGFKYRIIGVKEDDNGFAFSNMPDFPQPIDYSKLINIVTKNRMNIVGEGKYDLSKNWFNKHGINCHEIKTIHNNLSTFFRNSKKDQRLWTTFKDSKDKIAKEGRFKKSFLQISSRATNEYKDKTYVAYLANRFADPNMKNFFKSKGIQIDEDKFALSEMLQWIWRSAIRDDKPINLYIPSKRMRDLLINWMEEQNYMNSEEFDPADYEEKDTETKTFEVAASPTETK